MGFGLLLIGFVLLVSAYQGTQDELFALAKDDFTGSGNYFYWIGAFIVLVALGNIKAIKPVSDAFIVLVVIALILANYRQKDLLGAFFAEIKDGTNG